MAMIGGGSIGIEFAQMFHRFGVNVSVLERRARGRASEDQKASS